MTYKIEQIEGIGTQFGFQLMSAGVHTANGLLDHCSTTAKLNELELATGISAKQLSTWTRQADLMRISGIGPEFGELLEKSGVESVTELAARKPENIAHLMARVNDEQRLTRAVPAVKTVEGWVEQAKAMTAADALVRPAASHRMNTPIAAETFSPPASSHRMTTLTGTPRETRSEMVRPTARNPPGDLPQPAASQLESTTSEAVRAPAAGYQDPIDATERQAVLSR